MKRLAETGALTIVTGLVLLSGHPLAWAHGRLGLAAPREDPSRLGPRVDGSCDDWTEYQHGWRSSNILYQPRLPHSPARVRTVSTADDLYVCVSPMPLRPGVEPSSAVLGFDTRHDGGRAPDDDDLRFTIDELGGLGAQRGDGSGFVDDPSITGWAAAELIGDDSWGAEFRIPLSLLGGGEPLEVIGFFVQDDLPSLAAEAFTWPHSTLPEMPSSWANLLWLHAQTLAAAPPRLDVARITQGLELDVTANRKYFLITGKDTLISAQLYTTGPVRDITEGTCTIEGPLGTRPPPVTTVPIRTFPTPRLNPYPYASFNGGTDFDCFVPGDVVAALGSYRFTMQAAVDGARSEVMHLGTRWFWPTKDFRVFLYPWADLRPTAGTDARDWGNDLTTAIAPAMLEMQRLFPVRRGAQRIPIDGRKLDAGLRYFVNPVVDRTCSGAATPNCNALQGTVTSTMAMTNAMWAAAERADGVTRDRLDLGSMLQATVLGGGGQCCWLPFNITASAFAANVNGPSAWVVAHEAGHWMGLVAGSSPNSDGGLHSSNQFVATTQGRDLVNLRNLVRFQTPLSLMWPFSFTPPQVQPATATEGWEWNALRLGLETMARPEDTSRGRSAPVDRRGSPLFHLVGTIDLNDEVSVLSSQRVEELPLALTQDVVGGAYELAFLDASSVDLGGVRFDVGFADADEPAQSSPLVLTAVLPEGSARVEIRRGTDVLFSRSFSAQAPGVSQVVATDGGQGGIDLAWVATDADGSDLVYNIYFEPGPDAGSFPIAVGLMDPDHFFSTELAPATSEGRLVVEATDGYNAVRASSNSFVIPEKPPFVAITAPAEGAELVTGQRIMLVGLAHDLSRGTVEDAGLSWSSSRDGLLGTGARLEVVLSAGLHDLTLTATSAAQLAGDAKVTLAVLEDADGDGLPDGYEEIAGCLSATDFDSDQDPDGDSLTSLGEWRHGTDPCGADSDVDGVGDGDEVNLGSDPLDAGSGPSPELLFFGPDHVDLGSCPTPSTQVIDVQTASPEVEWSLSAEATWIDATGGGMGDGKVRITANCQGLVEGSYLETVLVKPSGGLVRSLEVSLASQSPIPVPPDGSDSWPWSLVALVLGLLLVGLLFWWFVRERRI